MGRWRLGLPPARLLPVRGSATTRGGLNAMHETPASPKALCDSVLATCHEPASGYCLSLSVAGEVVIPGPPEGWNPESRNTLTFNILKCTLGLNSGLAGRARAPE